jgi:CheY-like chemotaxis protein
MESFNNIPQSLIDEIKSGNCIAFVGAGFSAPALPTWDDLIRTLKEHENVSAETREAVTNLLDTQSNYSSELFDKEAAAQLLEDELSTALPNALKEALKPSSTEGHTRVRDRKRLLEQIPFQAILTTNFDDYLQSTSAGSNKYAEVLNPIQRRWVDSVIWEAPGGGSLVPIVKLHGQLSDGELENDVVLSRSGYRKLLFERPDYANFLKAVLVTRTVLFIGFSFSDSYLNLLRSEVLNLIQGDGSSGPKAYAIMNDLTDEACLYLLKHEGIHPIRYSTDEFDGDPDHSGFDDLLTDLSEATNPKSSISEILAGKRILWLDPAPDNNTYAMELIHGIDGDQVITTVDGPEEAIDALTDGHIVFDLVITHWGHDQYLDSSGESSANAQALMRAMRRDDIEVPVVVFASGFGSEVNRPKALALGAFEYVSAFEDLFASIEQIFKQPNQF